MDSGKLDRSTKKEDVDKKEATATVSTSMKKSNLRSKNKHKKEGKEKYNFIKKYQEIIQCPFNLILSWHDIKSLNEKTTKHRDNIRSLRKESTNKVNRAESHIEELNIAVPNVKYGKNYPHVNHSESSVSVCKETADKYYDEVIVSRRKKSPGSNLDSCLSFIIVFMLFLITLAQGPEFKEPVSAIVFPSLTMIILYISRFHGKKRFEIKVSAYLLIVVLLLLSFVPKTIGAEKLWLAWSYKTPANVNAVSISANGDYIAIGNETTVCLLDKNKKFLWKYKIDFPIVSTSMTGDASRVVVAGSKGYFDGGAVYYFNRSGKLTGTTKTKTGVSFASYSPAGKYLAIVYDRGLGWWDTAILWDYSQGKWLWYHDIGSHETGSVSVSTDGKYIVTGGQGSSGDGGIRLYNNTGKLLWKYKTGPDTFSTVKYSVSISPNGKYIAAGNQENNYLYFFNNAGKLLWYYNTGVIKGVSVSAGGNYIAVAGGNNLYLFDYHKNLLGTYKINNISSVSISANGMYIAAGGSNGAYLFQNPEIASKDVINNAKASISSEKSKGFIVTKAENLLSQSENAYKKGDYSTAREFAEQAVKASKAGSLALSSINNAKASISSEKSKGFIVTKAENLLSQSENAYKKGDYSTAREFAEQAKGNALEVGKAGSLALSSINNAKASISSEKSKGFIVTKAENLLSQSENAYKKGDYSTAREFAEQAYSFSIDTDQDGIINNKDFAPNIKNSYIYTAGTMIASFLIIISISVIAIKKKRRIYYTKLKECKIKLQEWKSEGYDVSELESDVSEFENRQGIF